MLFRSTVGLALAVLGIGAALALQEPTALLPGGALAIATLVLVIAGVTMTRRRRFAMALGLGIALAIPFHGLLFAGVGPRLDALWLSRNAAILVADHTGEASNAVAAAGYSEPSLVFMLGTGTILTDGTGAADAMADGKKIGRAHV